LDLEHSLSVELAAAAAAVETAAATGKGEKRCALPIFVSFGTYIWSASLEIVSLRTWILNECDHDSSGRGACGYVQGAELGSALIASNNVEF
jgi:hypothetical protein